VAARFKCHEGKERRGERRMEKNACGGEESTYLS